jgi:hypothetical protein
MRALIVLLLLSVSSAHAQLPTVKEHIEACKRSIDKVPVKADVVEAYIRGLCGGFISATFQIGRRLEQTERFCPPAQATVGEAMRIAIAQLDADPKAADKKSFDSFVLGALREAWPCK